MESQAEREGKAHGNYPKSAKDHRCLEDLLLKQPLGKGPARPERILLALAGSKLRSFMTSLAPLGLPTCVTKSRYPSTPFLWVPPPHTPEEVSNISSLALCSLCTSSLTYCTLDLHDAQTYIFSSHLLPDSESLPYSLSHKHPKFNLPKARFLGPDSRAVRLLPLLNMTCLSLHSPTFCPLCWLFSGCTMSVYVFVPSHSLFCLECIYLFSSDYQNQLIVWIPYHLI